MLALWCVPPSKADIPIGQHDQENTGEKNKNQHQHPIEDMIKKAFGAGFDVAKSHDHAGQALFAVRTGQELIDCGDEGVKFANHCGRLRDRGTDFIDTDRFFIFGDRFR